MINLIVGPISVIEGMAGSKRLFNVIHHLAKNDNYTVTNLIYSKKKVEKKVENIHTKSIAPHNKLYNLIILFSLLKYKNRKSKNIFYFYGQPDIYNFLLFIIIRLFKYKIVIDIVEDYSGFTNFNSLSQKVIIKSKVHLARFLNFFSDGIIYINHNLKQTFSNYKKATLFLPISIIKEQFIDSPYSRENNAIKIFYGGSYEYKDGIDDLIVTFDEIRVINKNLELHLTGKGSPSNQKKMLQLIKNKEGIYYHGYISDAEYFNFIKKSDILCMPRKNISFALGGYPFKLGEYLASGNAVLASKIDSIKEAFHDNELCFYQPDNTNDLKIQLEMLINDKTKRKEMGQKGQQKAFVMFDSKNHANQLNEFLSDL